MIKVLSVILLAMVLVASIPSVRAWDRAECEEVDWGHPDCAWGKPEPTVTQSHHLSHEAGSVVKRVWYGVDYNETTGCSTFIYALVWPAKVHPGTPTVVFFPDRKATFCKKSGGKEQW